MDLFEQNVLITSEDELIKLLGIHDKNIKIIKTYYNVNILMRNGAVKVTGDKESTETVAKILRDILNTIRTEGEISDQKVVYLIEANKRDSQIDYNQILKEVIVTSASGRIIKPKTVGQKRYVDMINSRDVTFGIGPAGTGKTYLAVACAVNAFRKKEVERIVLTRPAVEAGEKLGFLPGDLQDKVDPYLRPLYDALFDIMGIETFMKNVEKRFSYFLIWLPHVHNNIFNIFSPFSQRLPHREVCKYLFIYSRETLSRLLTTCIQVFPGFSTNSSSPA
jgi:phosphate starvation-inducible PhoH-like protein